MSQSSPFEIPFMKMHGLGNDFILMAKVDFPDDFVFSPHFVRSVCHRQRGIGADQLILLEGVFSTEGTYPISFYNADGSPSGACGNGTRCVAGLLFEQAEELPQEGGDFTVPEVFVIQVRGVQGKDRLIPSWKAGDGLVTVDMGEPDLVSSRIPVETPYPDKIDVSSVAPLPVGRAVGMGNPHCVFFVGENHRELAAQWGSVIETHPFFPQRTNVEFAHVESPTSVHLTVWERGAGLTEACGTGACATVVAGVQAGVCERSTVVHLPGGALHILWDEENHHVYQTGGYTFVGEGMFLYSSNGEGK